MKYTLELITRIQKLRDEGLTIPRIAQKLDLKERAVHYIIIKYNLPKLPKRDFNFNENYFAHIDSPDKAYWLGFIFADGSVNRYSLRIELQIQDSSHLEKLKSALGYEGSVKPHTDKQSASLKISSVKLISQLNNLGICPQKTTNPQMPAIPDEYFLDFLLGFFDGDGGLSVTKLNTTYQVSTGFLVHNNLLQNFKGKLQEIFPKVNFKLTPHHSTPFLSNLCISGIRNARYFLTKLYRNSSLFLDRKRNKYEMIMSYSGCRISPEAIPSASSTDNSSPSNV